MSRPTLDNLVYIYDLSTIDPATGKLSRKHGLAAVLRRLADVAYDRVDEGPGRGSTWAWLRAIAAEADPPPEPDTKALKAAALEVRDESDATMRHIKAMNAAMDMVLTALDGKR
jgi:hypothetical protein